MRVQVTQEDIIAGRNARGPGNKDYECQCPVALAIARALDTTLAHTTAYLVTALKRNWHLPLEVTHFIREFDSTGKGEPFEFDLV